MLPSLVRRVGVLALVGLLGVLAPLVLAGAPSSAAPPCLTETGAVGGCDDVDPPVFTASDLAITVNGTSATVSAVAGYDDGDVERLLGDAGIVRHRGKITATIANAQAVEALRAEGTSLEALVWSHAPAPRRAPLRRRSQIPAETAASAALAKALRKRGLRFVGPTTVYAFMQAMGLVDDHAEGCEWRRT